MLLRKKLQALEDPLKDSISNYPSEESNRSLGMKVEEGGLIISITVTYMICPGIHKFCLLHYYYYYYYLRKYKTTVAKNQSGLLTDADTLVRDFHVRAAGTQLVLDCV